MNLLILCRIAYRTYLWFDEKGKKVKVAAPQYSKLYSFTYKWYISNGMFYYYFLLLFIVDYVMTFIQKTINGIPNKYIYISIFTVLIIPLINCKYSCYYCVLFNLQMSAYSPQRLVSQYIICNAIYELIRADGT